MATIWQATFDYDDADGDNITDASLSAFNGNVLGAGAGTQATFNKAFAYSGAFGAKFIGTATLDRFISTSFTSQDELWYRFYIYIDDIPTSTVRIFRARASSTQTSANMYITSTGQFRIGSNSNDNIYTTTSGYTKQWVRVEWRVQSPPSGTGSQRIRVYAGANLTSATTVSEQSSDVAVTTYATGLISNQFGVVVSPLAPVTLYMDQIVASDTGWVGPIAAPPTADFTASTLTPTVGQTVTFTNASTGAVSYLWNFGDGTATSTAVSPTHSFASSGSYEVLLTATNSAGSDQASRTVNVQGATSSATLFDLDYESGVVGDNVVESGYPVTVDGGTLKYVSTNMAKGSRAVELDNTGGPAWMSYAFASDQTQVFFRQYLTITKTPIANPMVIATAVNNGTGAVVASLVVDQHGKWSLWRGSGGIIGVLSTESDAATSAGILTRVEWRVNCSTSIQTLRVFVGSNAHGTTPDITLTGALPTGSVVSGMRWGDSQFSNAKYIFDGTAVGVVDWIGAIASPNAYSGAPTAGFVASSLTIAKAGSVQLTNRSLGAPTSYSWNFGDSSTGTGTSPSHTYANGGTFPVQLTATNASGTSAVSQLVVTALDPARGKAVPKVRVGGVWRTGATTGFLNIRESGAWSGQGMFRVYKGGQWSSNLTLDGGNPDPGTGTGWGGGTAGLTTWYGSSLGYSNYSGNLSNFGGLDVTRTYTGGSPNNWDWGSVPSDARAGMGSTSYVSWFSYKLSKAQKNQLLQINGGTLAQSNALKANIRAFFDSVPTNYRVILTCNHEPENDPTDPNGDGWAFNFTEWRQVQTIMQDILTQSREARTTNKQWLKYASVIIAYTHSPGSGRDPDDWNVPGLDMWGYDAYNLGPQRLSAEYAIDHGMPWGYGEVGNRADGSDAQMYDNLLNGVEMWTTRATKPKAVCYWQQVSVKGTCWEIVLWPTQITGWRSGCPAIPARPTTLDLWQQLCTTGVYVP